MIRITVPANELWDDANQEFISVKQQTLQLEHSLVSLSKWESKWRKSFLSSKDKTYEETLDYIKCMTITQNVDPYVYLCLTTENVTAINDYIDAPMTATVFYEDENNQSINKDTVTSELIYYWMIAYNIPFDKCEKWHLNRLITLIRVCAIKNKPPKKMSPRATASQYAALNAARRKKYNTKG